MSLSVATKTLLNILKPDRLTHVVDIGANPIDGQPPYLAMLQEELLNVTGFEPQDEARDILESKKSQYETYLPYAVGDGKNHELRVCLSSGMTSLLEPSSITLPHFDMLNQLAKVEERLPIATKKLDEIAELSSFDFLKIDIQGFELEVFRNGKEKLKDVVAIQTEISFIPLYEKQPTMGEVDMELRSQGFIPHCMPALKRWVIAPMVVNNDPRVGLNQLLEADIVYVKDFMRPDSLTDDQLKHLALIAHCCYASYDLANRCILLLEKRGTLIEGSATTYLRSLA